MPIGGELFKGMSWLFLNLNDNPLGAAILAGLFLISVVFGIHQGFVPVYFALMEAQGFNLAVSYPSDGWWRSRAIQRHVLVVPKLE